MEDPKAKILQLIKIRGPIVPSQISKDIKQDLLMTSAILSELVSLKQLCVSNLKIGSTPLYYTKGQEYKLQNYSDKLNEKDRIAFDLLKEKKILQDRAQTPLIRVALRQIKDFAVPLEVTANNNKETFWKFYTTTDEESRSMIASILSPPKKIQPKPIKKQAPPPQKQIKTPTPKPKQEQKKSRPKVENQTRLDSKQVKKPQPKPIKKETTKQPTTEEKKILPQPKNTKLEETTPFLSQIANYFRENNIEITSSEIIRKNSEAEFNILLPTPVGKVEFFCKAKSKKKLSDADLASLFIQGQMKKLPILLLTPGQLTKKAEEMLKTEFKTITIKNI